MTVSQLKTHTGNTIKITSKKNVNSENIKHCSNLFLQQKNTKIYTFFRKSILIFQFCIYVPYPPKSQQKVKHNTKFIQCLSIQIPSCVINIYKTPTNRLHYMQPTTQHMCNPAHYDSSLQVS